MIFNENTKGTSIGQLINELSKVSHTYFQQQLKQYNIGHGQIRTLFVISHHKALTQKELSAYLNLDKSSITSQLQILERNGYIKRVVSEEDGRKQNIKVTEKAKQVLEPIKKTMYKWTDLLLRGFSEEEKEILSVYLIRMRDNVGDNLLESSGDSGCRTINPE